MNNITTATRTQKTTAVWKALAYAALGAGALFAATVAKAQTWGTVATVSGTLANGQMCYTDGLDIICPSGTPYWDATNSRLGLGTTSPIALFDITNESTTTEFNLVRYSSAASGPSFNGFHARGTVASPATLQSGDVLFAFGAGGYNGSALTTTRAKIQFAATENWVAGTNEGASILFQGTNTGSASRSTWMSLVDGNLGIGTTSPGAPLHVYDSTAEIRLQDTGTSTSSIANLIFYDNSSVMGRVGYPSSSHADLEILNSVAGGDVILSPGASGFVGIKTADPTTALEVDGTVSATQVNVSGTIYATNFSGDGSALTGITADSASTASSLVNGTTSITIPSANGEMRFDTAGSRRMTLDISGNLGIGTTAPGSSLTVAGNVSATQAVLLPDSNAIGATVILDVKPASGFTGAVNGLRVKGTGNVEAGSIASGDDTQLLNIAGGETYNTGANIIMYGPSHAQAGDFLFRIGTTNVGRIDNIGRHHWYLPTDGTELMHLDSVGLDVSGIVTATSFSGDGSALTNIAASTASSLINGTTSITIPSANGEMRFDTAGARRMTLDTSGNLGIGTTSPGQALDVAGTAQANQFYVEDGNAVIDRTSGALDLQTFAGNDILLSPGGSVGIGTTSPASYSAFANHLVVADTAGDSGITIASAATEQGGLYFADGTTGAAAYAGYLDYNHTSDKLLIGTAGTNQVAVDSDGNVGIGTTTPSASLTVVGGVTATSFSGDGSGLTGIAASTASSLVNGTTSITIPSANGEMRFDTAGSRRMTLDTSGNLGIGTTAPQTALEVAGTISTTGFYLEGADGTDYINMTANALQFNRGGGSGNFIDVRGVGDSLTFRTSNAGDRDTNAVIIAPDGDVTVAGTLTANAFSGDGSALTGIAASTASSLVNGTTSITIPSSGGEMRFDTAGSRRMTLDTSGRLGIGTSTPTSALTVAGASQVAEIRDGGYLMLRPSGNAWDMRLQATSTQLDILSGGALSDPIMSLLRDGNVGIGTTTPSASLTVVGDASISDGVNVTGGNLTIGTYANPRIWINNNGGTASTLGMGADSGAVWLGSTTASPLYFMTNSSEVARFTASGNLAIGTTTAGDELTVVGSITARESDDGNDAVKLLSGSSSGAVQVFANGTQTVNISGNSNPSYFTASNVGIGTTAPNAELEVAGTVSATQVNVSGTIYATSFSGDGSGLTGIAASTASSLVNGTTSITIPSANGEMRFDTAGSRRMTLDTSGRLGIGTASPNSLLHVSGGTLRFDSANAIDFARSGYDVMSIYQSNPGGGAGLGVYNETDTAYRMFIKEDGNVGIGTTNPGQLLDISGSGSGEQGVRVVNGSGALTVRAGAGSGGYGLIESSGTNGMILRTADASSLQLGANGATNITINSAGNVGVGTANPIYPLDVSGTLRVGSRNRTTSSVASVLTGLSDYGPAAQIRSYSDGGWARLDFNHHLASDSAFLIQDSSGNFTLRNDSTGHPFIVRNSSSELMRVNSSGNVGIGTTSPSASLTVVGGITATSFSGDGSGLTGIAASTASSLVNGTSSITIPSSGGEMRFDTAGSRRMTLDTSGNVGIGTTTPARKFVVRDTGAQLSIRSDDGQSSVLNLGDASDDNIGRIEYDNGNDSMAFRTNAADRVTIDSSGNVGIGTAAPSSELHIDGGTGTGEVIVSSGAANYDAIVTFMDSSNVKQGFIGYDESQDTVGLFHDTTFAGSTSGLVLDNSGNVGIGTATPSASLTVVGGITATSFSGDGSGLTGIAASTASSLVNGTSSITIPSANGDVHIDAGGSRVAVFDTAGQHVITGNLGVGDNSHSTSNLSGQGIVISNNDGGAVGRMRFDAENITSGYNTRIAQTNSGFEFESASDSRPIIFETGSTLAERMRIANAGVGIGTASPSSTLHVYDSAQEVAYFSGSGHKFVRVESTSGGAIQYRMKSDNGNRRFVAETNAGVPETQLVFGNTSIDLLGDSSSAEFASFDATGATVSGTLTATSFSGDGSALTGISASTASSLVNGTTSITIPSANGEMRFDTAGSRRMTLDTSGNLGIGTASPSAALHVAASSNVAMIEHTATSNIPALTVRSNNASYDGLIQFARGTAYQWYAGIRGANSDFVIDDATVGSTAFMIDAGTGNIGIGTTSPSGASLTVAALGTDVMRLNRADTGQSWDFNLSANDLNFQDATGGGNVMTLTNSTRRVGIGTTDPAHNLQVQAAGGASFTVAGTVDTDDPSINLFELFNSTGSNATGFEMSYEGTGNTLDFVPWTTGARGSVAMSIERNTGEVGIGTTTPSYDLHVNGVAAGTAWVNLSDRTFKENITDVADNAALQSVLRLRGVTFEWKDQDAAHMQGTKYGFIAQEVEEVLPEVVVTADDGTKSVDYVAVVPVLVEALKAQQAQIDELRKELEALKSE